jgi:hypothetical protein
MPRQSRLLTYCTVASVAAEEFERTRINLDQAFTRDAGQLSSDEYQGYLLPSEMKASLQLFVAGGDYDSFDRFVELLRNDPDLREAYNSLKCRWDGKSMDLYRKAKNEFIERAVSRATGERPRHQGAQ